MEGGGGPSLAIDRGGRDPVTPAETGDGWGKHLLVPRLGSVARWVNVGGLLGLGVKGPG